jgi:hypothetical protein
MTGGDIFSFQKDEALGHAVKKTLSYISSDKQQQ